MTGTVELMLDLYVVRNAGGEGQVGKYQTGSQCPWLNKSCRWFKDL